MAWKRGKKLLPVTEPQAVGDVARVYSEIRSALGITFVPVAYQLLASEPVFLLEHWRMISPLVESKCFRQCADRLRAEAYTQVHSYFKVPDMQEQMKNLNFSEGAKEEVAYVVDLFHYLNPALLLIFSIQAQAFEGPVGATDSAREPGAAPKFLRSPLFTDDALLTPATRRILEDAKQATGLQTPSSDLRALARWPELLETYWNTVKGMVRSPLFSECQRAIADSAASFSKEVPGPLELSLAQLADAGMGQDEISSVVRTIENMVHGFSMLCLNVSIAKIGMESGNLSETNQTPQRPAKSRSPLVA